MFINSDDPIMIGGSQEPAALVSVLSVDGINEVDNKLHSAALFSLMTKHLKINEDRYLSTYLWIICVKWNISLDKIVCK